MKSKKRLKLAIILIVCAITIAFAIATFDYLRHKQSIVEHHDLEMKQIEEIVVDSIVTMEKAYFLFDKQTVAKMAANSEKLIDLYKENPNFNEWDFHSLREELQQDIYIINDQNVITHSSLASDIGLDFSKCCQSLSEILDARRSSVQIFVDRMDMEQDTGLIKMYSYMATPDHKYIIQLGYNVQDDDIFEQFNFLTVTDQLTNKYPSINEINVLNFGGLVLGKSVKEMTVSKKKGLLLKKRCQRIKE